MYFELKFYDDGEPDYTFKSIKSNKNSAIA